ncbi:TPA: YSIRK-type signal peptide-containing protein, partial [Staphylococcus delphini]|nr:YSIRK-type signal peptide-containing protein [Staphylococcus delphini]
MKKSRKKRVDFLPNRQNRYAIRRFSVGTASILVGATLIFGIHSNDASAAVEDATSQEAETTNGNSNSTEEATTNESTTVEAPTSEEASTEEKSEEAPTNEEVSTEEKSVEAPTSEEATTEEKSVEAPTNEEASIEEKSEEAPTSEEVTTEEKSEEAPTSEEATTEEKSEEAPTSEEATTEEKSEEAPTSEEATTEEKSVEAPTSEEATTEEKSVEAPTTENTLNVDSNTNDSVEEILDEATAEKTIEGKKQILSEYLVDNTGVSQEESLKILENLNLDYTNLTSEELLANMLLAIAQQQDSEEIMVTPLNPTTVNTEMESITMEMNGTQTISNMSPNLRTFAVMALAALPDEQTTETLATSDNYTFQTLIFDPAPLTTSSILNGNSIPFEIDSYMTGANSGDRYKIDLKIDPLIASHVTSIVANPAGSNTPVSFTRTSDENGNLTNIWEINFIRANGGLFGGAEILDNYTAKNGVITLDTTVQDVLNQAGDLLNNKLNYEIYVRDSRNNTMIDTAHTSGYFLTPSDGELTNIPQSTNTTLNNQFKASSGTAMYDGTITDNGAIVVDQVIMKNGIFDYNLSMYTGIGTKQFVYNYQIDPDLLPYVSSVELQKYDFQGVTGFDTNYDSADTVATLNYDATGKGSITDADMNKLIEFNNSTPESIGVRMVIKLNQSVNNILTRTAEYDTDGNLIGSTTKVKEEFTFYGYFTDKNSGLVNNTLGTSTLYIQDVDADGLTDRYELENSLTDPQNADTDSDGKNDGDEVVRYLTDPNVAFTGVNNAYVDDTAVHASLNILPSASQQTGKIIDSNGNIIATQVVTPDSDGIISVNIPPNTLQPGEYIFALDSPEYQNDETIAFTVSPVDLPDNTEFEPTVIPERIEVGSDYDLTDNVNNIGSLPIGTIVSDITTAGTIDNQVPGNYTGTLLVTYPDGTTDTISVPVTVSDTVAPDAPTVTNPQPGD